MNRLNTFMDFNSEQSQDVVKILSDLGVSAYLYRRADTNANVGYDREAGEYQYVGTILVYLHPLNTTTEVTNEVGVTTNMQQLGITSAPLKLNDEIRFNGQSHRVVRIDNQHSGKTEFVSERKL